MTAGEPAELACVLAWLDEFRGPGAVAGAGWFDAAAPVVLGRAPGRLDVLGGFADYSGSLTLELPLGEAAYVAVQEAAEPSLQIVSAGFGPGTGPTRHAAFPIAELREHMHGYAAARRYFQHQPDQAWTAYVAGVLAALAIEEGRVLGTGLRLLVASSVPEGKGVSSSAAIEVATLAALSSLWGLERGPVEAALLCQRVENLVVGAPCGVMDQMTSSCGSEGELLGLLCQPAQLEGNVRVPAGLRLWGIDSGLRHQVSGADYTEVRVAAFMGYRCIAAERGLSVHAGAEPDRVVVVDPEWGGYLARVPRAAFEREYRERLPERLLGAEFLHRFGGITDPITRVVPSSSYRVRAAAAHPIYEHARCLEFRQLLASPELSLASGGRTTLERLGQLLFEAHDSYTACGLGSTGTDRIVELVRELGPQRGLFGAKITGGGSGGTVVVLGQASAADAVREVARRYAEETGHVPHVFSGSSPGAAAFGTRRLRRMPEGWTVSERLAAFENAGVAAPRGNRRADR